MDNDEYTFFYDIKYYNKIKNDSIYNVEKVKKKRKHYCFEFYICCGKRK